MGGEQGQAAGLKRRGWQQGERWQMDNRRYYGLVVFTTFHSWAQRTWISDFLYGLRFDLDWPWRETAMSR